MSIRLWTIFASCLVLSSAYVILKKGIHIQLKDFDGNKTINASTSNRLAFDERYSILYVVAREPKRLTAYVLDPNDRPTLLVEKVFDDPLDGYPLDIELCNVPVGTGVSRLAITFEDPISLSAAGTVRIFQTLTPLHTELKLLSTITVGSEPIDLEFTQQCSILLVANRGRPTREGSFYRDPEGTVTKILLPRFIDESSLIETTTITFTSAFTGEHPTEDIRELKANNFRYNPVRDPNQELITYMQNIEPERIVASPDGNVAFVSLPKNNAIARLTLEYNQVSRIFALGNRSWENYHLDPSDQDNMLVLRSYNIHSLYQSTEMAWLSAKGEEWVVTLDTGRLTNTPIYNDYTDYERASTLHARGVFNVHDQALDDQLHNDAELGRLLVSKEDGVDSSGKITDVFTFGGRGFSVRDANDFEIPTTVVESIERFTVRYLSRVYNSAYTADGNTPQDEKEATSPAMGPYLTALDIGQFEGKTVMFIAGGQSGIIYVYVLSPDTRCLQPVFQSVHRFGDQTNTWESMYSRGRMGDIGVTDLEFISTPNIPPVLVVAGSNSNSISFYPVVEEPFLGSGAER